MVGIALHMRNVTPCLMLLWGPDAGGNPVHNLISDARLECVTPDRAVCGSEFIGD